MPKKKPIRTIQVKDANSDTLIELDLSVDDEAFVIEYFNENMNATRAYLKLHPKAEYTTARSGGSQIVAKRNIRARIEEVLKEKAMGRDEVLSRLGDMARGTHKPYIKIDEDGFIYFDFSNPDAQANIHLIKKIKTKRERRIEGRGEAAERWEGEWVEVELHDPQKALELLGKYYKMFGDKETEEFDKEPVKLSIPIDIIGPDFFASHRAIHSGLYNEFIERGGRGSLKSSFFSVELIELLVNNPTAHALVMRQVADTLRGSVYAQVTWAIDMLGLSDKFKMTSSPLEITYIPTGQKIYFRGADDPKKIKSIKPPFGAIKILWFEELPEFHGPDAVRDITQSAIRGTDEAWIFKSYNPPRTSGNWVNKYVLIPKEKQFQHISDYRTAPPEWLGSVFIDEAEHLKAVNYPAYEHEYLGIVNGLGDMVFVNLEICPITDDEIAKFDNVLHGLDFGYYPHPAHYAKVHYDATRHVLYVFGEVREWKHGNEAMYKKITDSKLYSGEMLICDSAEEKSVQDYRAYGARARGAEKGPGSVDYSIKWMQSLAKIVLDPSRVPYSVEEMTDYAYERTKDGDIIDAYPREKDDAIAAIRYATNLIWRQRGK